MHVVAVLWQPNNSFPPGGVGGLLGLKTNLYGVISPYYSYVYDGRGDVGAVLDSNQNPVASYKYDPFGVLTLQMGTLSQPYMFSTKRYFSSLGLSYYGYRFYNPMLGRWMTHDPIGEKGGLNLYGFVGNSPVDFVDPVGEDPLKPNPIGPGITPAPPGGPGRTIGTIAGKMIGSGIGAYIGAIGGLEGGIPAGGAIGGAIGGPGGAIMGGLIGGGAGFLGGFYGGGFVGGYIGGSVGGWIGSQFDNPCAGNAY